MRVVCGVAGTSPRASMRIRPTAAYGVIGPKPLLRKTSAPYVFSRKTSMPVSVEYDSRSASSGFSTPPRSSGVSSAPPHVLMPLFEIFAYVPEIVPKPNPFETTSRGTPM